MHEIFDSQSLLASLDGLLADEALGITALSNVSALLYQSLAGLNWAGFYLVHGGSLILGPFQGKVACTVIPYGRGVCGHAWKCGEVTVVPDVHAFPGHIACDGASNSEIVLPIRDGEGNIRAVLDIDSPHLNRFDEADIRLLTECAAMIGRIYDRFADLSFYHA